MAKVESDERTIKLSPVGPHDKPADQRITLLIYHEEGLEAVPLVEGRSVVVGRASPAQVTIPHPSLSRQHARFEMSEGQVWVEDLGSTNGTTINGEAVTRAQVGVDQDVVLGTVTVSVHTVGRAEGFQLGLAGHDRFLTYLEQEIVRQRTFGRKLGLLIVQAEDRKHGQLRRWVPRIKGLLRPVDQVSLYSPSAVEIAVPEATPEELQALARQLTTAGRAAGEPTLLCGLGLYPDVATGAMELLEVVRTAVNRASAAAPVQQAEPTIGPSTAGGGYMVQRGPAMQKVYASVDRLAKAVIPVLIVGETGAGKEVIARAIHEGSPRRERPLRCINCAAIPRSLIESTMFGHEKGAFTGADRRSDGIFREADGGTVLLDEIGELSAEAQAALLRALETKRIMRVGSSEEQEVDVRVLAATHRDLEAMCAAGDFRLDLLYRINAVTLVVPPLRERPEEIEPLARHFMEQACEENGFAPKSISPEALEALRAHTWPGNVRELRNVIHRAVVMGPGEVIGLDDLPERLGEDAGLAAPASAAAPAAGEGGAVADSGVRLDFKTRIQNFETKLISEALAAEGGNKTAAAMRLGLPLRTLSYKMKTLGIELAK